MVRFDSNSITETAFLVSAGVFKAWVVPFLDVQGVEKMRRGLRVGGGSGVGDTYEVEAFAEMLYEVCESELHGIPVTLGKTVFMAARIFSLRLLEPTELFLENLPRDSGGDVVITGLNSIRGGSCVELLVVGYTDGSSGVLWCVPYGKGLGCDFGETGTESG